MENSNTGKTNHCAAVIGRFSAAWRAWLALLVVPVLLVMLSSCGGGGDGYSNPGLDGVPDTPEPNPAGVLLDGPGSTGAVEATVWLPPSPASESDMIGRLLTTRLEAIISPDASVDQVNNALESENATIVSMRRQSLFVTLKIPAVTSEAEAVDVAARLQATDGFLYVRPGYTYVAQIRPDSNGSEAIGHLQAIRMPAAWNAAQLARFNPKVTVLVPDYYYSEQPHPQVSAMRPLVGNTTEQVSDIPDLADTPGRYIGNHGVYVSGILGADFDDEDPTGTNPDPTALLDIVPVSVAGLTPFGVINRIVLSAPATGNYVLNTSIASYDTAEITEQDKYNLAVDAMHWRQVFSASQDRFFHASAAGNTSRQGPWAFAKYASAFNAASRVDDLRGLVEDISAFSTEEQVIFERIWTNIITNTPEAATRMNNTTVVIGVDGAGMLLPDANTGVDVGAPGESIMGPCSIADPSNASFDCDGALARYGGTSAASPLVAGLAAYLWALDPALTATQIRQLITDSFIQSDNTMIDAYHAVLAIDRLRPGMNVRKALLDVTGPNQDSAPNGRFDEQDIEKYLDAFAAYEGVRQQQGEEADDSRYDLNGDGFTGPAQTAGAVSMDLDADGFYTTLDVDINGQTVTFNEAVISDMDALCYFAFSDLYVGNTTQRDALLETQCGTSDTIFVTVVQMPPLVPVNGIIPVDIRAGINGNGVAGIALSITVTGASVTTIDGQTDASGDFSTTIEWDGASTQVRVEVTASQDELVARTEASSSVAQPDGVVIRSTLGSRIHTETRDSDGNEQQCIDSVTEDMLLTSPATTSSTCSVSLESSANVTVETSGNLVIDDRGLPESMNVSILAELQETSIWIPTPDGMGGTCYPVSSEGGGGITMRFTTTRDLTLDITGTLPETVSFMDDDPEVISLPKIVIAREGGGMLREVLLDTQLGRETSINRQIVLPALYTGAYNERVAYYDLSIGYKLVGASHCPSPPIGYPYHPNASLSDTMTVSIQFNK